MADIPATSGKGTILFSQWDFQNRVNKSGDHDDPVAARLLLRLLEKNFLDDIIEMVALFLREPELLTLMTRNPLMLKGISPLISPELLKTLCEMGHGDEIILADAHFPGHSVHPKVIRADGLVVTQMLDAILPLMALDHAAPPVIMMAVQQGDTADPAVEPDFRKVIDKHAPGTPPIQRIDRFEFYERARQAFAVVMTTETRTYGNILLKKGVTPVNYAGGTGK